MVDIEGNVARLREEIQEAALRSGRSPDAVTFVAATKTQDAESIRRAIAAGVDACGENRVQELTAKRAQGAYTGAPLHFIGHLQKNKVSQVVGAADLIQSVDSMELAELIARRAERLQIVQPILLEVNIGGEAAKSGVAPQTLAELVDYCATLPALQVQGLMAIPPVAVDGAENRKYFAAMAQLFVDIKAKKYDNVSMSVLSMGMSGDFISAILEGSNMVRLGTGIFGPRG